MFTLENGNIISRTETHNHEVIQAEVSSQIMRSEAKRKIKDDICQRQCKIIHAGIRRYVNIYFFTVKNENIHSNTTFRCVSDIDAENVKCFRGNIENGRRKILPKVPSNIQVFDYLENSDILILKQQLFKFFAEMKKIIWMEHFKYCTKFFLQFFTIHVIENGLYIPVIFCILPDKRQNTYLFLFNLIC